jgi:hypothetical protein
MSSAWVQAARLKVKHIERTREDRCMAQFVWAVAMDHRGRPYGFKPESHAGLVGNLTPGTVAPSIARRRNATWAQKTHRSVLLKSTIATSNAVSKLVEEAQPGEEFVLARTGDVPW